MFATITILVLLIIHATSEYLSHKIYTKQRIMKKNRQPTYKPKNK
jgi:hypothetical protein